MTSKPEQTSASWQSFAEEALDMWQNQLTALAGDPKAKEDWARVAAPFGQMFNDWTSMLQQAQKQAQTTAQQQAQAHQTQAPSAQAHAHDTPFRVDPDAAPGPSAEPGTSTACNNVVRPTPEATLAAVAPTPGPAPTNSSKTAASGGAAVTVSDRLVAELALRVARLERKLDTLVARLVQSGQIDPNEAKSIRSDKSDT